MVRDSHNFILAWKLKELKKELKAWNKDVFGFVTTRKEDAMKQFAFEDLKKREFVLSFEEREVKRHALEDYTKWTLMEEISWRQKS